MWKKIAGALLGGLFILRWSRRMMMAGRLGLVRSPGAHLVPSVWLILGYVAASAAVLFGFATSENPSSTRLLLFFMAIQFAAVAAAYQMA